MTLIPTPRTSDAAASTIDESPPSTDTDKVFHTLDSTAEPESDPSLAQRWGLVRHLHKLHDTWLFVAQIGERM